MIWENSIVQNVILSIWEKKISIFPFLWINLIRCDKNMFFIWMVYYEFKQFISSHIAMSFLCAFNLTIQHTQLSNKMKWFFLFVGFQLERVFVANKSKLTKGYSIILNWSVHSKSLFDIHYWYLQYYYFFWRILSFFISTFYSELIIIKGDFDLKIKISHESSLLVVMVLYGKKNDGEFLGFDYICKRS